MNYEFRIMNLEIIRTTSREETRRSSMVGVLLKHIYAEYLLLKSMIQDGFYTDSHGSETISRWRSLRRELVTIKEEKPYG